MHARPPRACAHHPLRRCSVLTHSTPRPLSALRGTGRRGAGAVGIAKHAGSHARATGAAVPGRGIPGGRGAGGDGQETCQHDQCDGATPIPASVNHAPYAPRRNPGGHCKGGIPSSWEQKALLFIFFSSSSCVRSRDGAWHGRRPGDTHEGIRAACARANARTIDVGAAPRWVGGAVGSRGSRGSCVRASRARAERCRWRKEKPGGVLNIPEAVRSCDRDIVPAAVGRGVQGDFLLDCYATRTCRVCCAHLGACDDGLWQYVI
jgi:hypothetical protein